MIEFLVSTRTNMPEVLLGNTMWEFMVEMRHIVERQEDSEPFRRRVISKMSSFFFDNPYPFTTVNMTKDLETSLSRIISCISRTTQGRPTAWIEELSASSSFTVHHFWDLFCRFVHSLVHITKVDFSNPGFLDKRLPRLSQPWLLLAMFYTQQSNDRLRKIWGPNVKELVSVHLIPVVSDIVVDYV